MTEWLLSGHNPQEWTGIARPMTLSSIEEGIHDQMTWFLKLLAGETNDLELDMRSMVPVQGRLYLNVSYLVRNVAAVVPFDVTSVGVPQEQVPAELEVPPSPLSRKVRLPGRFYRMYKWAADFDRERLPGIYEELQRVYRRLHQADRPPLEPIWTLFDEEAYGEQQEVTRSHAVITLVLTVLDGLLRQQAPQLLGLLIGQATATSQMGPRIWELRLVAEECGPQVQELLKQGVDDLDAYQTLDAAAPLMSGIHAFLQDYGHRGFRFERDYETERLIDHPEHLIMAIAAHMDGEDPPEVRAKAAREAADQALRRMDPVRRSLWRRILGWGRQLITWREESNTTIALRQATYGLAARHLARHFYPEQPDDTMMLYNIDEFVTFTRSRGEERVDQRTLDYRRAQFELYQTQPPPPELIWFDPETQHWRPTLTETESDVQSTTRLAGIAASAGSGPAEGTAIVTNDPLDAARRLMELEGPAILITRLTDPAWSSLFPRLSGVVTELGGVISHAAIVARESGLPAVVGVPEATRRVRDGQYVRVDGSVGSVEVLE